VLITGIAGDDDTRAELSSSISQVTTIYPDLQASLSRKWNSREAAIGELRVCVDALFDVLSTLDDILETLLEERVVPGLHQLEPPVMGGEPALSQFMAHETTLKAKPVAEEGLEVTSVPITEYPEGGSSSVADSMVSNAGSLGVEGTQDGEGSAGEERENPLEKVIREEKPAHPMVIEGTHQEIYQQYIKDQFPQAVKELDIEGLAKGSVECYERLVRLEGEREEGALLVHHLKPPPSGSVPTTLKNSGIGPSAPLTIHPIPRTALLAPPPSISRFSQSTVCSKSSEPKHRSLLPKIPEHSPYSSGFKCTFCGVNQVPSNSIRLWR
jgi:hypothetical protein